MIHCYGRDAYLIARALYVACELMSEKENDHSDFTEMERLLLDHFPGYRDVFSVEDAKRLGWPGHDSRDPETNPNESSTESAYKWLRSRSRGQ